MKDAKVVLEGQCPLSDPNDTTNSSDRKHTKEKKLRAWPYLVVCLYLQPSFPCLFGLLVLCLAVKSILPIIIRSGVFDMSLSASKHYKGFFFSIKSLYGSKLLRFKR